VHDKHYALDISSHVHCSLPDTFQPGSLQFLPTMYIAVSSPLPYQSPDARVSLKLDGANGVGALKVRQLIQYLQDQDQFVLQIDIVNDGSSGALNDKVGRAEGVARWLM